MTYGFTYQGTPIDELFAKHTDIPNLTAPGTLLGFGNNTSGELGLGDTNPRSTLTQVGTGNNWTSVHINGSSVYAIRADGTLWAWGDNMLGQLGLNNRISVSSPVQVGSDMKWHFIQGSSGTLHAIKTDGTLWGWSNNDGIGLGVGSAPYNCSSPVQVGSMTDWVTAATGTSITAAIKQDGTLWAWGFAGYNGISSTDVLTPVQVGSSNNWSKVSAGAWHIIATKNDGTLWTWGYNAYGQLGDNTSTDKNTPTAIATDTQWQDVVCINYQSFGIKTDGTLWAWGQNDTGQLGTGGTSNKSSPTQVGTSTDWKKFLCRQPVVDVTIMKNDGSAHIIGNNSLGPTVQVGGVNYPVGSDISGISWANMQSYRPTLLGITV